ncbi:pentatricopeptide repeat-containing protein At3g12770-like [Selaginella moellendorffii]|uniref:pentatricopeptide repeat-containing protein At3g12770-like n=1 Tax=Selaginella moellendorffii TaxID=88036 RepID=UPI000D1C69D5|nr:pentatricopeptide repeat-containing protein At3g12770-like [Selaginella moellendorffii]|eukprot:XP_024532373.1 pentatricopeptide repeat-containing protein At3g12770-like [Selaginella moellendorffii]
MNIFKRWITLKIHARFDRSLYNSNRDRAQLAALVHEMNSWNKRLEDEDYANILDLCGKLRALQEGQDVHAHIHLNRLERNRVPGIKLTQMYGKCGRPDEARRAFAEILSKEIIAWTSVVEAHAKNSQHKTARELFLKMKLVPIFPDEGAYLAVLRACVGPAALKEGKAIHAAIVRSALEKRPSVAAALINMYAKCESLADSSACFAKVERQGFVPPWIAMIAANAEFGHLREAAVLFQRLLLEGILVLSKNEFTELMDRYECPADLEQARVVQTIVAMANLEDNSFLQVQLMAMFSRCGDLKAARAIFDGAGEENHNVNMYRALIEAYVAAFAFKDAILVFREMLRKNVTPDRCIYLAALAACTGFEDCKIVHSTMRSHGVRSDEIYKSYLIRNYRRCPEVDDAERMFAEVEGLDLEDADVRKKCRDETEWVKLTTGDYTRVNHRVAKPFSSIEKGLRS